METILIVDDEKNYPLVLGAILEEEGYETLAANSGHEALEILKNADVDLVLTDMKMPGMDGIELMERIKRHDPDLPVIMMTAHGTVEKAVEAMEKGAFSYILKPFENDRMILYVKKACALYRVIKENRRLKSDMEHRFGFGNLIGKSKAMRRVFEMIEKVAPTGATVLIEGESGTGKELVARAIHYHSPRREEAFVAVNCGALAESLLESELFGHERGAFTGAVSMKKGRFELADKGTLLLDEIGEMPKSLQVKLLRVLQEKSFERVGGTRSIPVDVRLIAATNKRLKEEVASGRFREDLFFRLNVIPIGIPPLRERREDIPLLVDHFIKKFASERQAAKPVTKVDPEVLRLFYAYPWPGNVRELEYVIERAVILSPLDTIRPADLPPEFRSGATQADFMDAIPEDAKLEETLELVERKLIERALRRCGNVQSSAAELLGIGKSVMSKKVKKHDLSV